jgi:hypothetical protein
VAHTYFLVQDYPNVLSHGSGGDSLYVVPLALSQLGRQPDAIRLLRERLQEPYSLPRICSHGRSLLALLEGRIHESVREAESYLRGGCRDPESVYYLARQFAHSGLHARALEMLNEVADQGYVCFPALLRDPWLHALRADEEFSRVVRRVEASYRTALEAFLSAAGDRLLGVRPA